MELKLGHKSLLIRWQHHNPPVGRGWARKNLGTDESIFKNTANRTCTNQKTGTTFCQINTRTDKKSDAFAGMAFLNPKDISSFTADKGRKIALANALKAAMISKKDRKTIWNKYHKQFGISTWNY